LLGAQQFGEQEMEHSSADMVVLGATVILGFVVVPVWLAAGLADYVCHRAARIERSSGVRESLMHLVQFALVGVPLAAALFLRIDAGMLLVFAAFVLLHHAVAYVDVRYANATRPVHPVEQMIHSFLELLPIAAVLLAVALDFAQFEALFGRGVEAADFSLRWRTPALPAWYTGTVLAAAAVFGFIPYVEELLRCVRMQRRDASFRQCG
jgi:hypothetical protein